MTIIPLIERDKIEDTEVEWLQLYDENKFMLAKSDNKDVGSQHEVTYDDITYVADTTGRILLDYKTVFNKFNRN